MHAWQFARGLGVAGRHGWIRFVSMQNLVNLLYREEEREMLPLCAAEGIGVIPWSPQARGKLTQDWNYTSISDRDRRGFSGGSSPRPRMPTARSSTGGAGRGRARHLPVPRWRSPGYWPSRSSPPIVGATKLQHLDDALAAVRVKLSEDEIASLEAPYVPHAVVGFD